MTEKRPFEFLSFFFVCQPVSLSSVGGGDGVVVSYWLCWCQCRENCSSTIHSILAGENCLNHNLELCQNSIIHSLLFYSFFELELWLRETQFSIRLLTHTHKQRHMCICILNLERWQANGAKLTASTCNVPTVE